MGLFYKKSKNVLTKELLNTGNNKDLKDLYLYSLNSLFFRSDEFINSHDEKLHVLFSGCSETLGEALPINLTWSKNVYNILNQSNNLSGYFNIAERGSNNFQIISDIYKYIIKYGKPNIIIINFTEMFRGYVSFEDQLCIAQYYPSVRVFNKNSNQNLNKNNSIEINVLLNHFYEYYLMLEEYCRVSNIQLICFSWALYESNKENIKNKLIDKDFNNKTINILKQFESYINLSFDELQKFKEIEFKKINEKQMDQDVLNCLDYALDKSHCGYLENMYWSYKVLERIFDDYSWN